MLATSLSMAQKTKVETLLGLFCARTVMRETNAVSRLSQK